jgi:hypothetical protein
MNNANSTALVRAACAIAVTAALVAPATARAQAAPSTTRAALEGHWTLVSVVNEKDGVKTEALGADPLGLFIYDRSGRYALQLYRAGLPAIAANDRLKATDAENRAITSGSLAHFGTYSVDEIAGTFTIRPVAGTFPNWVGKEMPRKFSVSGDELTIFNPSSSGNLGSRSYLVLRRAR